MARKSTIAPNSKLGVPEGARTEIDREKLAEGLTQEQIAARAYDIYVRSGCKEGQCDENWNQARRELVEEALNADDGVEHPYEASTTHMVNESSFAKARS